MWIEDEELKIFCDLLSEVYIDNYIEPSNEWTKLRSENLKRVEFDRFWKKKYQTEIDKDLTQTTNRPSHFWFEEPALVGDDILFQQLAEFLRPRGVIHNSTDLRKAYLALQWMLEDHGCYISSIIQKKLREAGILIDSSCVSEPEKKHIVIQATAQVIAYHNGYFNIKKIKSVILKFNRNLKKLLYLDQWKSARDYDESIDGFESKDRAKKLENLISSIDPIPEGKRRGRPPSKPKLSTEIIYIPGIFDEIDGITKINFRKLRIALCYLTLNLGLCDDSCGTMIEHPIILKYTNRVPIFLRSLLEVWIDEALKIADFLNQQS